MLEQPQSSSLPTTTPGEQLQLHSPPPPTLHVPQERSPIPIPLLPGSGRYETENLGLTQKRSRGPTDEHAPFDRPPKNARVTAPRLHMSSSPPPEGVNASIHAPHRTGNFPLPNDVQMTDNNSAPIIDPASGRQIINSRITIQNLLYTAPPPGGFPIPQITKSLTAPQSKEVL
ncbi:hypothetical protein AGABI1DRAFT_133648 [Agaricus bisporus var. burnettii JB137-S8]|uniref:Uncharacterized protein n=1 Tax=Agaricus bisporus var. burnettii (strain JB137-S8 / ATCC MYA-4627 / FGSC 10392) TaxID=597362 RepID=K5WTP4_AGABU|nr:uncharacterized protein AGABI1DRAFT_133648 [Agaricus bisporus var. burnettii JB137-S8]EKM74088.1 hypothetical protein AGABI1DRAFT_133648 [Agaricus bisporus var. burnettii JB137-S8]